MEYRIPLIAGNWKMFKTGNEAVDAATQLVKLVSDIENVDIVIAPPYTSLAVVSEVIRDTRIDLSAQDLYWEKEGAYTGQISASMLISAGCQYVIIGHSERRQLFGETNDTVNNKIKAASASGLIPILCVGETETQRDEKKTFSVLDKQMEKGLEGLTLDEHHSLVIAYEPVWAIGTGKSATPDQVQEVHAFLRDLVEKRFGNMLAKATRILYGGSVKPDNVSELMTLPDVDGALVGGASLQPDSFSKIIHF
ncbi:MAG: triose-phosphate isomerase [Desulfobacteraceae bacterium]|nr:triose-phosphate isomerase [Desulfobacteraceae bacterium]MBC2757083.1 triose-phosphate isomerase [Desulfobacteraceae bacterium]MBC2763700.1 triose-phosphate isomerase [ANME-2 cluster archaeon]